LIETLRISGLAIVDEAELEFGPGLNVLTGETGAGKSIVLGALALLSGARADSGALRDGGEGAMAEAIFDTRNLSDLEQELLDRGLESVDHQLVVRRTIAKNGRSRAQLAGQLVPVGALGELLAGRLEISSQHDSQSLRRPDLHGVLLDRIGGLEKQRATVVGGYQAVRELDDGLARLRAEAAERVRRLDFLSFQVREIDEAELDPQAIEALRAERARLAHAVRLGEEGASVLSLVAGDLEGGEGNAADRLGEALRILDGLQGLDPSLGQLVVALTGAHAEVREAGLELERYVSGLEVDPARLAQIDERLHQVEQLQRKYGPSVEEVMAFRERAAGELQSIEGDGEREARLLGERAPLLEKLKRDAEKLTRGRKRAAKKLAETVQKSLRDLDLPNAEFSVALEALTPPEGLPCRAGGREAPEFFFNANTGETPRPLRKVASGGELSRVFLAIKNATREADGGMVLVFDEVDAGIGGRTADRVGRALAELAAHHQVLCITHLPQVAAFADTHFKVEKSVRNGRTLARIARVEGADRVEEVARMAGGNKVGEATRKHARELLGSRVSS